MPNFISVAKRHLIGELPEIHINKILLMRFHLNEFFYKNGLKTLQSWKNEVSNRTNPFFPKKARHKSDNPKTGRQNQ